VTEPLVRKVSHVFVPVADPTPLVKLFTEVLGLPVAWPMFDYGLFRGAGVCLGNANLELLSGDATLFPFFAPTEPLTARGITFEPTSPDTWEEGLVARDLPYLGPIPYEGVGRTGSGHLWTLMYVMGLVADSVAVSLIEWHTDETLRGAAARRALDACGGGLLGVRGLAEITVGISDFENVEPLWRRFLAPAEPDKHGAFHLGDGPTVRLKPSAIDGVAGLWLEVESMPTARDALKELDMLGPMRASGVGLDYARTGGLDVWLTDRR